MIEAEFVFVSNYINHHQIPFCRAMRNLMNGSFVFIQTEPMEEERIRMGWNGSADEEYVKLFYEEPELCKDLIMNARVVLFGGTDEESYIRDRLEQGKLVIRYSERLYKTGQWKAVSPRGLARKFQDHTKYRKAPVYLLCSGAYVPSDFAIVHAYPGKMFCWGYFPETKIYDLDPLMAGKGAKDAGNQRIPSLLWSGRMIDWKHPELAVDTAKYLKDAGIDFRMYMIGGGDMEDQIKHMVEEAQLSDRVTLTGFLKPEEVREYMEHADIFLFTSDRQEGWGAVANEAMNSGCAVVADHMIGAAPYLIRHGENGFLYKDGEPEGLFAFTKQLCLDKELRDRIGRKAYETICRTWNAENAADSLRELIRRIESGEEVFHQKQTSAGVADRDAAVYGEEGFKPCAPAPVISERRMYTYLLQQ